MKSLTSTIGFNSALTKETKKQMDREAILKLAGKFHVTFDFAETFSPLEGYQREKLYKNESIEYIFVIKNEPYHISLQHILVVNENFVVKHWRQDWIYENTDFLFFEKEGLWKKKSLTEREVEGTWTQKVYQVDDCPRYQAYGSWVFVDGKSYWEGKADAPLPRRQEKRKDFNVLVRSHRIEITNYGWMMNQDNQKVFRDENGIDHLIVWEKGFEIQNRGDYNVQPAVDYWEKTQNFWADVRSIWETHIEKYSELKINEKVNGQNLYDKIFTLAQQFSGKNYHPIKTKEAIQDVVASHSYYD